jgi:hypothetical protein
MMYHFDIKSTHVQLSIAVYLQREEYENIWTGTASILNNMYVYI